MRTKRRFERRFVKGPGCWPWLGLHSRSTPVGSYGRFYRDGRHEKAHRVAYELYVGAIPPGRNVLHRCDRPHCVNPAHLFLGTHAENTWDAIAKGRLDRYLAARASIARAKLTPEKLERLRELVGRGWSQRAIARELGVSQPAVSHVVRGKTHRVVERTDPDSGGPPGVFVMEGGRPADGVDPRGRCQA